MNLTELAHSLVSEDILLEEQAKIRFQEAAAVQQAGKNRGVASEAPDRWHASPTVALFEVYYGRSLGKAPSRGHKTRVISLCETSGFLSVRKGELICDQEDSSKNVLNPMKTKKSRRKSLFVKGKAHPSLTLTVKESFVKQSDATVEQKDYPAILIGRFDHIGNDGLVIHFRNDNGSHGGTGRKKSVAAGAFKAVRRASAFPGAAAAGAEKKRMLFTSPSECARFVTILGRLMRRAAVGEFVTLSAATSFANLQNYLADTPEHGSMDEEKADSAGLGDLSKKRDLSSKTPAASRLMRARSSAIEELANSDHASPRGGLTSRLSRRRSSVLSSGGDRASSVHSSGGERSDSCSSAHQKFRNARMSRRGSSSLAPLSISELIAKERAQVDLMSKGELETIISTMGLEFKENPKKTRLDNFADLQDRAMVALALCRQAADTPTSPDMRERTQSVRKMLVRRGSSAIAGQLMCKNTCLPGCRGHDGTLHKNGHHVRCPNHGVSECLPGCRGHDGTLHKNGHHVRCPNYTTDGNSKEDDGDAAFDDSRAGFKARRAKSVYRRGARANSDDGERTIVIMVICDTCNKERPEDMVVHVSRGCEHIVCVACLTDHLRSALGDNPPADGSGVRCPARYDAARDDATKKLDVTQSGLDGFATLLTEGCACDIDEISVGQLWWKTTGELCDRQLGITKPTPGDTVSMIEELAEETGFEPLKEGVDPSGLAHSADSLRLQFVQAKKETSIPADRRRHCIQCKFDGSDKPLVIDIGEQSAKILKLLDAHGDHASYVGIDSTFKCPHCDLSMCGACGNEVHKPLTCDEAAAKASQSAPKNSSPGAPTNASQNFEALVGQPIVIGNPFEGIWHGGRIGRVAKYTAQPLRRSSLRTFYDARGITKTDAELTKVTAVAKQRGLSERQIMAQLAEKYGASSGGTYQGDDAPGKVFLEFGDGHSDWVDLATERYTAITEKQLREFSDVDKRKSKRHMLELHAYASGIVDHHEVLKKDALQKIKEGGESLKDVTVSQMLTARRTSLDGRAWVGGSGVRIGAVTGAYIKPEIKSPAQRLASTDTPTELGHTQTKLSSEVHGGTKSTAVSDVTRARLARLQKRRSTGKSSAGGSFMSSGGGQGSSSFLSAGSRDDAFDFDVRPPNDNATPVPSAAGYSLGVSDSDSDSDGVSAPPDGVFGAAAPEAGKAGGGGGDQRVLSSGGRHTDPGESRTQMR